MEIEDRKGRDKVLAVECKSKKMKDLTHCPNVRRKGWMSSNGDCTDGAEIAKRKKIRT